MSNKLEEKDLMKTICDLSREVGFNEGMLKRKTEMLNRCDMKVREMRDNNNRVFELIKNKIDVINISKINGGILLKEYNTGYKNGLKSALEILKEVNNDPVHTN